jgi:hypothetical protein
MTIGILQNVLHFAVFKRNSAKLAAGRCGAEGGYFTPKNSLNPYVIRI